MHHRYTGYLQNHEPLPSMAYFCYEVFTKRLSENVNDASEKYKISRNLIEEVSGPTDPPQSESLGGK